MYVYVLGLGHMCVCVCVVVKDEAIMLKILLAALSEMCFH